MSDIYEEIVDEHLDTMIRLALKQAEAEGLLNDEAKDEENVTESVMQETFELFKAKLKAETEQAQREERRLRRKRHFKNALRVLACIIIALAIATPVAIASINPVKEYFLRLLINVEEDHIEFQLKKTEREDVPEGWMGEYYPEYIPEGYKIADVSVFEPIAMFRNNSDYSLYFLELNEYESLNVDSEGAEIYFVGINDATALVSEENGVIRMVWQKGNRMFFISGRLSLEEATKMAKSVTKVD